MNQEMTLMLQTILSNGMSVSEIAKCVSKSEEEILELICQPPLWWLFVSTLSGKRRFDKYFINNYYLVNNLVDKNCIQGERKWKKFNLYL